VAHAGAGGAPALDGGEQVTLAPSAEVRIERESTMAVRFSSTY
jgi:hypothetical protein